MYSEITVHNYCLSIPATANGMIRATQKFPAIRYVVISTLSATKTTICMNSALLTTSSLTVSLVSDQDSQLKQLYYQLSILGFLYWITKMQSVQFSLISLKHLTLSHKPLLDSLSSLDLPPFLLVWLHSYLQGRTQQVIIALSSKSEVTSGVPQGSIILFINIS